MLVRIKHGPPVADIDSQALLLEQCSKNINRVLEFVDFYKFISLVCHCAVAWTDGQRWCVIEPSLQYRSVGKVHCSGDIICWIVAGIYVTGAGCFMYNFAIGFMN